MGGKIFRGNKGFKVRQIIKNIYCGVVKNKIEFKPEYNSGMYEEYYDKHYGKLHGYLFGRNTLVRGAASDER